MSDYYVIMWIGFAIFMLVCEALTSQLVSIWFVIGAISAAITCMFTNNLLIQTIVFLFVSLVALLITRPLVKKLTKKNHIKTNSDRLVGQKGIVTLEIDNNNGVGQVTVDGKVWSARSVNGNLIPVDTVVEIKSIEGVKLIVDLG